MTQLDDAIRIDGLVIARFSREVFEDMARAAASPRANCTCSVWHDFRETMAEIAQWKHWFAEHESLITQVHGTADILRAKREGRVGIILGWQNTSAIENDIGSLVLFRDLGVRIVAAHLQLAEPGRFRLLGERGRRAVGLRDAMRSRK